MRIYISRAEIRDEYGGKELYKDAFVLISELENRGHEIIYLSDYDNHKIKFYTEIYETISSCDCLLAFILRSGSTWRAAEVTYASRGVGIAEKFNFSMPVFLYIIEDCWHDNNLPNVHVLPADIISAADLIEAKMKI
ncbi:MAG: hypothetical protein FWD48_04640 [Oscillospiraceae bacterium]|nr:hypothetical protein [Oscillospiraceae bacterium]